MGVIVRKFKPGQANRRVFPEMKNYNIGYYVMCKDPYRMAARNRAPILWPFKSTIYYECKDICDEMLLFRSVVLDPLGPLDPVLPKTQELINNIRISIRVLLMQRRILIAKATIQTISLNTIDTMWLIIHTTNLDFENWKPVANDIQDLLDHRTGSKNSIMVEIRNENRMERSLIFTTAEFLQLFGLSSGFTSVRAQYWGKLKLYLQGRDPQYADNYPWKTGVSDEEIHEESVVSLGVQVQKALSELEKHVSPMTDDGIPGKLETCLKFCHTPGMGDEYRMTLFVLVGDDAIADWGQVEKFIAKSLAQSMKFPDKMHLYIEVVPKSFFDNAEAGLEQANIALPVTTGNPRT